MKQLLLISTLFLIVACKKDKVYPLAGNFLCEVDESTSYTVSNSDTDYDMVLALVVNNDSIEFDGYKFPTSSFNTLTGSGSHEITLPNSSSVTLTLNDQFKAINYQKTIHSGLAGPSFSTSITGERSELAVTSTSDGHFSAQEGIYDLYIQAFENYNSVDTSYFAAANVSYDPATSSLVVDGVARDLPLFHTYYKLSSSYNGGPYDQLLREIYWDNDSLYYHYHHTSGLNYPPSDTTHYHFQGSKL